MAKFSLFIFTVLLSLSLGLFVGQNYLMKANDDPNSSFEKTETESLYKGLGFYFTKIKNKFFANEEITINKADNENFEISEQQISKEKELENIKSIPMHQGKDEPIKFRDHKEAPTKQLQIKPQSVKKVADKKPKAVEDPDANPSSDEANSVGPNALDGWVIQVAAFQDIDDALKVKNQIISAGFIDYLYKTQINGKSWYRVNVGPFKTVTEATNYKQSQKVHFKFKGAFVRKL